MIGNVLTELREELKISQDTVAKALGVSRSALGYYERGERHPDSAFIVKAAKYYAVTSDYLLGLSLHKTAQNQAIFEKIPLSDEALNFLRNSVLSGEADILFVDDFLSSPDALAFFSVLYFYVASASVAGNQVPPEVVTLDDRGQLIERQDGAVYFKAMTAKNWEAACEALKKIAGGLCEKWGSGGDINGNSRKEGR